MGTSARQKPEARSFRGGGWGRGGGGQAPGKRPEARSFRVAVWTAHARTHGRAHLLGGRARDCGCPRGRGCRALVGLLNGARQVCIVIGLRQQLGSQLCGAARGESALVVWSRCTGARRRADRPNGRWGPGAGGLGGVRAHARLPARAPGRVRRACSRREWPCAPRRALQGLSRPYSWPLAARPYALPRVVRADPLRQRPAPVARPWRRASSA